jgi:uncharacterized protein (TIGR03435 family)
MGKYPVVILALVATANVLCSAQDRADGPAFEVASVKPNLSAAQGGSIRLTPGGRLVAQNATLQQLITAAYQIRDFELFGGPSWIKSEHFDTEAKPSGEANADQVSGMLQVLLADRFSLVVHHEAKDMPVYRLVQAKGGHKLSPSQDGNCTSMVPPPAHIDAATLRPCGGFNLNRNFLMGGGASLGKLAAALSRVVGQTVLDETGIEGAFDITLRWTPDYTQAFLAPPNPEPKSDDSGPSLFSAIQEQLGLRLEAGRGPVEVVVIDRVERLSGN